MPSLPSSSGSAVPASTTKHGPVSGGRGGKGELSGSKLPTYPGGGRQVKETLLTEAQAAEEGSGGGKLLCWRLWLLPCHPEPRQQPAALLSTTARLPFLLDSHGDSMCWWREALLVADSQKVPLHLLSPQATTGFPNASFTSPSS